MLYVCRYAFWCLRKKCGSLICGLKLESERLEIKTTEDQINVGESQVGCGCGVCRIFLNSECLIIELSQALMVHKAHG